MESDGRRLDPTPGRRRSGCERRSFSLPFSGESVRLTTTHRVRALSLHACLSFTPNSSHRVRLGHDDRALRSGIRCRGGRAVFPFETRPRSHSTTISLDGLRKTRTPHCAVRVPSGSCSRPRSGELAAFGSPPMAFQDAAPVPPPIRGTEGKLSLVDVYRF